MNKRFFEFWDGNDFADEIEPYIEVYPNGFPTDDEDMECLITLLLQKKKSLYDLSILQSPDFIRKHTEIDGSNYLVLKNGFQRISSKKNTMLNTLSGKNELIQIPSDPNRIWLLSAVVSDNEL